MGHGRVKYKKTGGGMAVKSLFAAMDRLGAEEAKGALASMPKQRLRELLSQKKDWKGWSIGPLAYAAQKGKNDWLRLLLELSAQWHWKSGPLSTEGGDDRAMLRGACRHGNGVLDLVLAQPGVPWQARLELAADMPEKVLGDERLEGLAGLAWKQADKEKIRDLPLDGWGLRSLQQKLGWLGPKEQIDLFCEYYGDFGLFQKELCVWAGEDRAAEKLREWKEELLSPLRAFSDQESLGAHFSSGEYWAVAEEISLRRSQDPDLQAALSKPAGMAYERNGDLMAIRDLLSTAKECAQSDGHFAYAFGSVMGDVQRRKASPQQLQSMRARADSLGLRSLSMPNPAFWDPQEHFDALEKTAQYAARHMGLGGAAFGGGKLSFAFTSSSYGIDNMEALASYLPRAGMISVYLGQSTEKRLVARSAFHEFTHYVQDVCFDLGKMKEYRAGCARLFGDAAEPYADGLSQAWARVCKALDVKLTRKQALDKLEDLARGAGGPEFAPEGAGMELAGLCGREGSLERGFEAFCAAREKQERCGTAPWGRLSEQAWEKLRLSGALVAKNSKSANFYRKLWQDRDESISPGLVYLDNDAEIHSRLNESLTGVDALLEEKCGYLHKAHVGRARKPLEAFNCLLAGRYRLLRGLPGVESEKAQGRLCKAPA